jgi:protein TonB
MPFSGLIMSAPGAGRPRFGLAASVAAHVALVAALFFVPVLWPVALPEDRRDYIRALLYDPPPPPPPPLPKGSPFVRPVGRSTPATPSPARPDPAAFTAPVEAPRAAEEVKAGAPTPDSEPWGSETGSDIGVPEGMEGGVEGGVVGGVPGGVLGGVIGGTGDIPVVVVERTPDRPPRPIRITKPVYPQDAFVKKIEGIVLLEILIDRDGRVVRARVLHSVPLLDAAALEAVRQWVFAPAIKQGQPVATLAQAPIAFRIF